MSLSSFSIFSMVSSESPLSRVGEEFLVNVGTFGPFPEIDFALVSGIGLFECEPVPM